jgi:hypothetical protein
MIWVRDYDFMDYVLNDDMAERLYFNEFMDYTLNDD